MISSHLKSAKKFKGRLNSSRNCSVCNLTTFNEMESSFPRFNHAGSVRNFRFPWQFPSLNATFSKPTTKKQCFLQFFRCLSRFSAAVAKGNLPKTPAIVSLANFKFFCDIQGSHWIGCLWVSLIIDQSECLICYFLCTELTLFCIELTLFCTELPENCIYLNQPVLSNFFMCIITLKTVDI